MTNRNTIIRECIAALPLTGEDTPNAPCWMRQANVIRALEALLSVPDQAESDHVPDASKMAWGAPIDGATMKGLRLQGDTPVAKIGSHWMPDKYSMWAFYDECSYSLPADHPYYRKADNWTPDERTLKYARECIVKALGHDGFSVAIVVRAIDQLTPKPDPIAALVDEWMASADDITMDGWSKTCNATFAAWLVSEGRLTL